MSPEIVPMAELPLDRKLELLDEFWCLIADDPALADVPQWHLDLLAERTAEFDRHPDVVVSWEELRQEMLDRTP